MGALPTERIASRSRSTHSQAAGFGRRQERRRRESLGSLCPSTVFMPQDALPSIGAAPGCVLEDDPSAAQAAHSLNYSGTASLTSAGPSGSKSWRAPNTHMACSRRSVGSQARTWVTLPNAGARGVMADGLCDRCGTPVRRRRAIGSPASPQIQRDRAVDP